MRRRPAPCHAFTTKQRSHVSTVVIIFGWSFAAFPAVADDQRVTKTASQFAFQTAYPLELSLDVMENYDDNIYLAGAARRYLPPSYTVPQGSVAALEGISSFVTTVSPKIALDLAPLLGDQNVLQEFSLAYAPDFAFYDRAHIENYTAHHFPLTVNGASGSFSFSLSSTLTLIDGSNKGPTFPGGLLNAYATTTPRDRRKQINDRAAVVLKYDYGRWFVRPTAGVLYYDMMTALLDVTGYQNYVSRYDVNGGADVGYRVERQLSVTLGYRYGHQYQQNLSFSPYSSPSDYQRLLVGIEGRPWGWLEVNFQGGPDFRSYPPNTTIHITPLNNKHLVSYYGEGSITATFSPSDALTFRYKGFQWVSQLGQIPYFDSTYELIYHRRLGRGLRLDLDGSILSADYTSGNLPASHRDDLEYNASTTLSYTVNAHVSLDLAYSFNAGRNDQSGVANPETRAFDRDLVSIKTAIKF